MTFQLKLQEPALIATEDCTGSDEISFIVWGTPVPQGSTRAFIPKGWNRPVITAANTKTKAWRQEIAGVALETMKGREKFEGPVWIQVEFYFERPKTLRKSQRRKITAPDLDKLVRSVFDALTGFVYRNDAQIVGCMASKYFGSPARMTIRIRGLND